MIIRKATEFDESQLAELFFVTRKATFVSRSHNLIQPSDYLGSTSEDDVWVAEEEGLIVGFVSTYPKNNFIHNLFVHPIHQKKAVGSALLTFAENTLSKPMTLKIAMDNLSVCAFYEKHIDVLWMSINQLSSIDFRPEPLKELLPMWLLAPQSNAFKSAML